MTVFMADGEEQGPYCLWYVCFLLHVLSFGYILYLHDLKFYHFVMFYVEVQLVGLVDYVCQCKSCGLFCISEMILLSFVYPFSKLFY